MAETTIAPKSVWRLFVPWQAVGLEHKLTLAFGFMSCIPILIIVWAMAYDIDLSYALYPIVGSVFLGYFLVVRRVVASVLHLAEQARRVASGRHRVAISVEDRSEIGELARSFNRITGELEHKVHELESAREHVRTLLMRIGSAITSYEGIDHLLSLIIENSAVALEATSGSLMLVDGEKQELYIKTLWSRDGLTPDPKFRLLIGEGVPGWVVKEGRAMRATGKANTLGIVGAREVESVVLSVPLKLRERAMGVITVLREDPYKAFKDDDELLLTSIGSQVAVAVENYRLNLDMERTYLETIVALALAVEAKDPYSAGHSKRVGFYATQIGQALGLDAETLRVLHDAGTLHDIGKIGIKDDILLKTQPLSLEEQKVMHQHPVIGEAIVRPVRSLTKVVPLVRHHHEEYDGSGYPSSLKGEEIPLGARILAVADTFDAMVTDRPYRKRLSLEEAKQELQRKAGTQYDPMVVEAFLRVLTEREEHLAAKYAQPPPQPPTPR